MAHFIGRHTYHAPDLALRTWAEHENIHIGSFCSISHQVSIFTGGRHRVDWVSTYPFRAVMQKIPGLDPVYQSTPDTVIGNDVWVGARSTISGGVQIGSGAVISTASVVFSNVPPYAIVAGNPAAIVRYRFSKVTVARLLRIAWWDWSDEEIKSSRPFFEGPVSEFLERFDPRDASSNG